MPTFSSCPTWRPATSWPRNCRIWLRRRARASCSGRAFRSCSPVAPTARARARRRRRSWSCSRTPGAGRPGHARMPDAILVLNAGSSSLKFSVFGAGPDLALRLAGNLEELQGRARFRAQDARGAVDTHVWADAHPPGHDGAIDFLIDWLPAHLEGDRLRAVGHRVVHGGVKYAAP